MKKYSQVSQVSNDEQTPIKNDQLINRTSLEEQVINENQHLKQQLKQKTIELASKAKEVATKNRLLLTLKEKLEDSQKNPIKAKIRFNEMQQLLDQYINIEDNIFEIQMDELHQDFFKKLKSKFPSLSIYDLRLCAYLKIGLNTKEIADLLNVQPSSTYISRSRLRRKLNLQMDEDLHSFLNQIASISHENKKNIG
ncbi:MAG TPA: hypothetical protein PKD85_06640 [Saprospiraceae bacterium]|nr:hypothetical protein [Saprospiraceae bacterium]